MAVVHHATDALLEPPVASAVSRAIRLALDHERYASGLERQLTTLEDARRRLVGATDRQRELTAARLRTEVVAPLEVARDRVARARTRMQQTDALDALDIVLSELERARDEVLALVAGTPSAQLGGGGLAESLRELSRRGAIPISVSIENGVAADPPAERALFYVATEAVTNALKHAQATAIELVLGRERDTLVLVVSDDGGGDADAEGSGVRGMADRLATQGGRLSILSPPGNGTVVTATIPVRGSSSRA